MAFIADHNKKALKGEASFYMKMNHFGDLVKTNPPSFFIANRNNGLRCTFFQFSNEFSERMNTFKPDKQERRFGSLEFVRNPNVNLSDSIDWRDFGAVTDVKNQVEKNVREGSEVNI